jgi:hypothetical protein
MLHLIYRSSGGANLKNRPAFFDKRTALASFLRALERAVAPVEAIFLNDGPVPDERVRAMTGAGEVRSLPRLGNSGSYREALAAATSAGWPDDDLVYLSEDDYLYLPDAFVALAEAAQEIPRADYFTLYDHIDRYRRTDDADGGRARLLLAGDHHWRTVESTCMSYGARVGALRRDAWIHRRYTKAEIPDDRTIWRFTQGLGRYRWKLPRRMLVGAVPALATHLETEYLAPAVDWEAEAAAARRWAEERGVPAESRPETT